MRLRSVHKSGAWLRRLRAAEAVVKEAAADAAAEALRAELARTSGHSVSIAREGARRSVGIASAGEALREFGTLERPASPWLAPVLPLAREPMRAAADSAVARAVSSLRRRKT